MEWESFARGQKSGIKSGRKRLTEVGKEYADRGGKMRQLCSVPDLDRALYLARNGRTVD